jgi:hypothetical protein
MSPKSQFNACPIAAIGFEDEEEDEEEEDDDIVHAKKQNGTIRSH